MNITKHQPIGVGEVLTEGFLSPMGLTQGQMAKAMGVSRTTANELCMNRRTITVDTALMLSKVFGNSAEFWLNLQRRNDLWKVLNSDKRRNRIEKANPIQVVMER